MRRNHLNVRSCRGLPSESRTQRMSASHPQIECVEKQSVEFAAASPAHQPWHKPCGLPCSAARVAGENGPSVRRAFGHAASPRRSTRHPGLPASRARPSPAAPPDCALVCFGPRPKRSRRFIRLPRPVGPFACSGRANLPSKHTHMSAEAYPPDGPQISPRQGSQNFSARAGPLARGGPMREGAPVSGAARGKLLRPASRRLRRP